MSRKGLVLRSAPRSGSPSRLSSGASEGSFAHASLRSAREGGFTLVEVLIVIVVIAILASIMFGLMHFVESSRIMAAEGRVQALGEAAANQVAVKGFPPAKLVDVAKSINEPDWAVDHWNNPIQYTVTGRQFKLWSSGPDGVSGTADDIRYKRN